MSRDELSAALRQCADLVADESWTVIEEPVDPGWFRFTFDHPLSSQYTVTMLETDDALERIQAFMAQPEFAIVARAPASTPHAPLMRLLRQHADGHRWESQVLGQVAYVLSVFDLLTADEASWLADAGPPWRGVE